MCFHSHRFLCIRTSQTEWLAAAAAPPRHDPLNSHEHQLSMKWVLDVVLMAADVTFTLLAPHRPVTVFGNMSG